MRRLAMCSLVAIVIVGCAADPHSVRITEQNKDAYMESIKDSKGLTVEEMGLLASSQVRRTAIKAFGGNGPEIVGKTVGDLIADERRFQSEAKIRDDEQKRLAAEAKAKVDALAVQMRGAIELTVFDKGFSPSNPSAGSFDDYITIKCAYENKSGKGIRAFTGHVEFTDLFGKEVFTTNLTISDALSAGDRATWSGTIKYNQFIGPQQNLKNADLANLKIVWSPSQVLFMDGSTLGGESR